MANLLSPDEVREYLSDYPESNLLLDKEEFGDTFISLCMELALSEYNSIPPTTSLDMLMFPSKSILLFGTCWQMFQGRSAMMARNQLSYSDGGLQIPVEEKYELYSNLAATFRALFSEASVKLKLSTNMEGGWSSVSSEAAFFPLW